MKVAVSAAGKSLDAPMDTRFGRAPYFVIIESEKGRIVDILENQGARAGQGAGVNAASAIARAGVKEVVTGKVGPKASAILEAAGIRVRSVSGGTLAEVLGSSSQTEAR